MGLGFAFPYLLAALPIAAGLLVYAYRHGGRKDSLIVASVFLLRPLARKIVRRTAFRPTKRFFLELLICLLLGLGAAGLFLAGSGQRVLLVLDTSQSMAAVMSDGSSRFDAGLTKAEAIINDLPFGSTVYPLTSAGQHPSEALPPTEAIAWLQKQAVSRHEDRIEEIVKRFASTWPQDQIVIITDKIGPITAQEPRIRIVTVGEPTPYNVALQYRGTSSQTGQGSVLRATLHRYGTPTDSSGEIQVRPWPSSNPQQAPIARQSFTYSGDQRAFDISVTVPASREASGYQMTLGHGDPLNLDNSVYFGRSRQEIVIVSARTPAQLKIETIAGVTVRHVLPAAWSASQGQQARLIISHGVAVETPAEVPLLQILGSPAPVINSQEAITSFRDTHPLLRYAQMAGLSLSGFQPLTVPRWGSVVVQAGSGPLIVAGEPQGIRQVHFGFELLPFEGKRSPLMSILFLNAVHWLIDGTARRSASVEGQPSEIGVLADDNFYSADESETTVRQMLNVTAPAAQKGTGSGNKSFVNMLSLVVLALLLLDAVIFVRRQARRPHAIR